MPYAFVERTFNYKIGAGECGVIVASAIERGPFSEFRSGVKVDLTSCAHHGLSFRFLRRLKPVFSADFLAMLFHGLSHAASLRSPTRSPSSQLCISPNWPGAQRTITNCADQVY